MPSYKVLHNNAFYIAKNPKYDGYQHRLVSVVYKHFNEKSATHKGTRINSDTVSENHQLAEKLHKPITRRFKEIEIYSSLKDHILGADLANMQSISKYNKGI